VAVTALVDKVRERRGRYERKRYCKEGESEVRNGIGTRSHLILRPMQGSPGSGLFGVDLTRGGKGEKERE